MLIDTHCHINIMIKKKFDEPITEDQLPLALQIIQQASDADVNQIINVGTSIIESKNCIELAKNFENLSAAVGIHPNDCTSHWQDDFNEIYRLVKNKAKNKIVAIGECGFDKHYPGFNIQRQKDAFNAHAELSLQQNLPLIIHSRDAAKETLEALDSFEGEPLRGVLHCFSEDLSFAEHVIEQNFLIGIGGPLTYPANDKLRDVLKHIPLEKILLETDAPFLPPQCIRGKENHPKYILTIAQFLAELRNQSLEEIAEQTTKNAYELFGLAR
jgi:TatD DNase family protein